jgi:hypothetical protein
VVVTSIDNLPTRKQKWEIECDFIKKFTIYKEEEIKGKTMVSCLRLWQVDDNRSQCA